MIPFSYNMVDMGGIDLAEANHTVVPGLYEILTEAMNACGDVILYNWKFVGIEIVPSPYSILQLEDLITINGLIQVTELDQVTVVGIPPPIVPVEPLTADANGVYHAQPPSSGFNPVTVAVPPPVIRPKIVTENGVYFTPEGVDGFNPVDVNVSGDKKGFEVYAADGSGGARTNSGWFNNNYFACFFDDNMSSTYTLNGVSATYSTIATGKQQILATTRDVTNQPPIPNNALIQKEGSVFTTSHGDSGSYASVVGGWVGYPSGGAIYESAAVGTSNSVTLNSAHETLLIFIGATSNTSGITTVDLNGATYTIENIGNHYNAYGMYTAIEINGNSDTNITVTFPASCWSYVSVIGIDS